MHICNFFIQSGNYFLLLIVFEESSKEVKLILGDVTLMEHESHTNLWSWSVTSYNKMFSSHYDSIA